MCKTCGVYLGAYGWHRKRKVVVIVERMGKICRLHSHPDSGAKHVLRPPTFNLSFEKQRLAHHALVQLPLERYLT
jgi:hypothetical protein